MRFSEKGGAANLDRFTKNNTVYTLVASQEGKFRSFYSNRKAPGEVNSQKAGYASSPVLEHNIPQISENTSQTDENGLERTETDGLRFSIAEYSEEEQRDIVDVLKPFTGSIVDKSPEEYAAYLKDKGVDIPDDDAFRFAQEAARQKNERGSQGSRYKAR